MNNKWFVDNGNKNSDQETMLCLPYAGASISMFSTWPKYVMDIAVCPVILPFRDARRRESLPESLQKLAEIFVEENIDILQRKYYIFGHCTGAVLAYEIARQAYEKTNNEPIAIIASSSQAPKIIPEEALLLANASDLEIKKYLQTEKLIDETILEMSEFTEYYFPILRSDFRLFAGYHAAFHKFECPIFSIYDPLDTKLSKDKVQAWEKYTETYKEIFISGGHYSVLNDPKQITEKINQIIKK